MKYRIVIPVVAQSRDFENLLKQIPNKRLLTIVNNFDNDRVAKLCKMAKGQGAEVINWPENRGCAASWNVGLKMIDEHAIDFVVILSPSCVWNNDVTEFIEAVEKMEYEKSRYMYIARGQHQTDTHAFAITRKCLNEVGTFDENFHPVYFEDSDYYRRLDLIGAKRTYIDGLRKSTALNGGVKHDLRVWKQYLESAEALKKYYKVKWGGGPGRERFPTPFGLDTKDVRYWPEPDRLGQVKLLTKEEFKELQDAGLS